MTPGKPKMTEKPRRGFDYQQYIGTIRDNFGGKGAEAGIVDCMLEPKRKKGKSTMAITMDTIP